MKAIKSIHKLTPKQEKFILNYLIDFNGKQAAIRAGYSPKTAEVQAARMLSYAKVKEKITELQIQARKKATISRDEIIETLAGIIRTDLPDYFNGAKIKGFDELNLSQRKAMESIKVRKGSFDFKLISKLQAIQTLNKMLGYDQPTEISLDLKNLSEPVLDAIIDKLFKINANETEH